MKRCRLRLAEYFVKLFEFIDWDNTKSIRMDYRRTFNEESGRRVLADLVREFEFLNSSIITGDPMQTHENEAKKDVVRYIISQLEEEYAELENEQDTDFVEE